MFRTKWNRISGMDWIENEYKNNFMNRNINTVNGIERIRFQL